MTSRSLRVRVWERISVTLVRGRQPRASGIVFFPRTDTQHQRCPCPAASKCPAVLRPATSRSSPTHFFRPAGQTTKYRLHTRSRFGPAHQNCFSGEHPYCSLGKSFPCVTTTAAVSSCANATTIPVHCPMGVGRDLRRPAPPPAFAYSHARSPHTLCMESVQPVLASNRATQPPYVHIDTRERQECRWNRKIESIQRLPYH